MQACNYPTPSLLPLKVDTFPMVLLSQRILRTRIDERKERRRQHGRPRGTSRDRRLGAMGVRRGGLEGPANRACARFGARARAQDLMSDSRVHEGKGGEVGSRENGARTPRNRRRFRRSARSDDLSSLPRFPSAMGAAPGVAVLTFSFFSLAACDGACFFCDALAPKLCSRNR